MIPVFRLRDITPTPQSPARRAELQEMLRKAIQADEDYKRICKEKGIPYVPCVAADPYGANYYNGATRRPTQVRLGDIWSK